MFKVGDHIIYGATGVCEVTEITEQQDEISKAMRTYYVLNPVYRKGSVIYTPVDNQRVIMRPVIERSEAEALIDRMLSIPTIEVESEKNRSQYYKDVIRTYEPENLVRVLKTIYFRKQQRVSKGKKMLSSDETFLQTTEALLYGEMACSLEIPVDEVAAYITKRISEKGL